MSISVIANGETIQTQPDIPLPNFLEQLDQKLEKVVVEHNGQALTRPQARELRLSEGDKLEIVRIVAGG